jgi:predicted phosphate transport protein (TIGR00153 family)
MKIFPQKIDFFVLFDKSIANASATTQKLVELMENYEDAEAKIKNIYELEQAGDLVTHDIIRKLNQTFITPIDREDLHRLATRLDDFVDLIWASVDKMVIFKIESPTKDAIFLAKELDETMRVLQKAFKELEAKDWDHVKEHCIEINRMENRVDRIYRNALGELFDDYKDDPMMVIKWKDIYELLEDAADKCEDIANVLEGIVLKHA